MDGTAVALTHWRKGTPLNRRPLAFALLFILTTPLLAQSGRLVSRIEVRGKVPAPLVISQTALVEGRTYSDRDLDIAVSRIAKLPFVFDASYSMEGETLIIDVAVMTRFYADFDVSGAALPHTTTTTGALGGGARFFAGAGGVAEVTADRVLADSGGGRIVGLHYSHYGIAGTRFFASAGVGQSIINDEELEHDPSWLITVGYPLTIRQTLTASASGEGFTRRRNAAMFPRPLVSSTSRRNVNIRWSYDTTDDAFFARHGEIISASPSWTSSDSQYERILIVAPNGPNTILAGRTKGDVTALNLDATKYWAVGARDLIFSTFNASAETGNLHFFRDGVGFRPGYDDANSVSLTLGAGRNFFDWTEPAGTRQRLEVGLRASRRSFENTSFDSAGVMAAWTLRRQYMNVKLGFSYEVD